ncbi:hypothetical protein OS493_019355 [Desmophyllum pertusum]|uniref:Uncharacterized protein n=1 Tax=Desmophyllum pertusum TaxID=174260 RepID=A0A9X0A436_9CNID|nr:hypothetical protein OS493_019355 [Desmophyllum pertusum]
MSEDDGNSSYVEGWQKSLEAISKVREQHRRRRLPDEELDSSQVPSFTTTMAAWCVNKSLCPVISYWVALMAPNGAPPPGCHQNRDMDVGMGTWGRVWGRRDARTGTRGREIGDAGSGT